MKIKKNFFGEEETKFVDDTEWHMMIIIIINITLLVAVQNSQFESNFSSYSKQKKIFFFLMLYCINATDCFFCYKTQKKMCV